MSQRWLAQQATSGQIRKVMLLTVLMAGTFCFSSADANGLLGQPSMQQQKPILLTRDAGDAYIEALEFCLQQVGKPVRFSAADKQQMISKLHQGFSTLPLEARIKLSQAREIWTQYRNAWPSLSLEEKRAFGFDVLSLAYGDAAAYKALGMNPRQRQPQQSAGSGGSSFYKSGDAAYVSDGECSIISIPGASVTSGNCD